MITTKYLGVDKNGQTVRTGHVVQIPFFPEYADKYYVVVETDENEEMYVLSETDDDGEELDKPHITVEPWKVQLV